MDIYEQVEAGRASGETRAIFNRMARAHAACDTFSAVGEALALLDHPAVTEDVRARAWLVLGQSYLANGDHAQALQYLALYLDSPRGRANANRLGYLEAFVVVYNGHAAAIDDDIDGEV